MAIKSFCVTLLLLFVECFIFGQSLASNNENASESSYTIQETEEGLRFVQRIDWAPIHGIIRYEIILEQRYGNSNRYNEFLRENTEEPFLELSIPAGNYRYKVLGYNVLNRLGAESDYQPFEVFQAVQPSVEKLSTNQLFLEDNANRIVLTGEHFVLNSEIYLVPTRGGSNDINQAGVLIPSEIIYSDIGDSVELVFENQELPSDRYRIVVVNPGGLTSTYEPFDIRKSRDWMDINISAGYAPLLTLSGNELTNLVDQPLYPLGFVARVSLIPFKTDFGYFGIELSPFYNYVDQKLGNDFDDFTFTMHVTGAALSILYQIPFLEERLFLNVRLGGGLASFVNMQFENDSRSDSSSFMFPEAQVGLSAQYFVYNKQLFLELGMDYKLLFPETLLIMHLNPFLSLGWKF
jgi:hypothetical protein